MKKIKLQKLTLTDWRGQTREISFNDNETQILGKNGCGKTSIMYAWLWLMTGYTDEVLPKNSSLYDDSKPITKDTPKASVEACIAIDGVVWTLKRSASPKFTKDKETGDYVREKSDAYTYAIDGVPLSATKFNEWIEANICELHLLPYCLSGAQFSALSLNDKNQARSVLQSIVGSVTEKDLKGDYSLLADWFAKDYPVSAIVASVKNKRKEAEDALKQINWRIEETSTLINNHEREASGVLAEIEKIKPELEALDKQLSSAMESEEAVREKRVAIRSKVEELEFLQRQATRRFLEAQAESVVARERAIEKAIQANGETNAWNVAQHKEYNKAISSLEVQKRSLVSWEKERERLVEERNRLKSQTFDDAKCEYCGQPLPEDEIERLKEKKMARLEEVIKRGKEVRAQMDDVADTIKQLQATVDAGFAHKDMPYDIDKLREELKAFKASLKSYEETEEYIDYQKRIDELKSSMPSYNVDTTAMQAKRKELQERLYELNGKRGSDEWLNNTRAYLDDCNKKREGMADTRIKAEQILDKCKEFNEESANVVSARVNDKLTECQVRMYEVQKNGELTPSCTITDSVGVKLLTVNHSKRLLMEVELQQMFCEANGVRLPIFIDEANCFDDEHRPHYDGWQSVMISASNDPYMIVK